jgi:hypothetical protein
MIPEINLANLSELEVSITGQWSPAPKRDWQGAAVSSEPIVGLAMMETESGCEWCLSGHTTARNLALRVALFPYEKVGLDVQVNFSVGNTDGHVRGRSAVASPAYVPSLECPRSVRSGQVFTLAKLAGKPSVVLKALFLARCDIRTSRNGIWHIATDFEAGLPAPFRKMLCCGRKGTISNENVSA